MQKDAEQQEAAPEEKPAEKPEKKEEPKKETKKVEKKEKKDASKKKDDKKSKDKKKDEKKDKKAEKKKTEEDNEIPMDAAAIKAYSSVIADAAEDSEPSVPVQYHQTMQEEEKPKPEPFQGDAMASMIQNEISSIKDASVKAAKENAEWAVSEQLCCCWLVDLS